MNVLKKILISLLSIIVVVVLGFGIMFKDEIGTIMSIEKIDESGIFYEAYIKNDYALDELIAAGGASSDGELTNFLIKKLLKGLPIEFSIPDFGCTTFQAQNEDGDWIFARNYDLDPITALVIKTNPKNGYKSIAVVNGDIVGIKEGEKLTLMDKLMVLASPYAMMDGMNEKGLSIGVLLIRDTPTNQNTEKPDITTTSLMRMVLDKAATVNEAIELFKTYDMHASAGASYHFQITDANGDSVIIEYINDEISILTKSEFEKQFLTNFIVSPENYGMGSGHDRYEIIEEQLKLSNGILSEEEAMKVLSMVYQNKPSNDGGITETQWSTVYNNQKLTMDITIRGDYNKVYTYMID